MVKTLWDVIVGRRTDEKGVTDAGCSRVYCDDNRSSVRATGIVVVLK
jgi:hypothetical protein